MDSDTSWVHSTHRLTTSRYGTMSGLLFCVVCGWTVPKEPNTGPLRLPCAPAQIEEAQHG